MTAFPTNEEGIDLFVATDIHYLSKKTHDNGTAFQTFADAGDKLMQYSPDLLLAQKDSIEKQRPEIMVIAGDLTCNGDLTSHKEVAEILSEMEGFGTKVYVVPGNHDLNNRGAVTFHGNAALSCDFISEIDFEKIYKEFGYKEALSRDIGSLSYLAAPFEDLWLLMLDSTMEFPNIGGKLQDGTIAWISECSRLSREKGAEVIVVMHHNSIDHSDLIFRDYTIEDSEKMRELIGEVRAKVVLTGHIHIQDVASYECNGRTVYDIATSSLSVYPHQFGKLHYTKEQGYTYETEKLDLQEFARVHYLKDEFLNNFEAYATSFFYKNCCKNQKKCVDNMEHFTTEEKLLLGDIVSEINKMYFSGFRGDSLDYIQEQEGYKILVNLEPCPLKDYLTAVMEDERRNHNRVKIEK